MGRQKKVITDLVKKIQNELKQIENKEIAVKKQDLMKQVLQYRGIHAPQIEQIFKQNWELHKNSLSFSEKKDASFSLIKSEYGEDKQMGVLFLKGIVQEAKNKDIDDIKKIIKDGHIFDWWTTDSLSLKFLCVWSKISQQNSEYIAKWSDEKSNLWVRRSCCITFVNRARHGDDEVQNFKGFSELMFNICGKIIKQEERFNQLACGWLLRNLTISNRQKSLNFLQENILIISREGLQYATEKLEQKQKNQLLDMQKDQLKERNSNQNFDDSDSKISNDGSDNVPLQKIKENNNILTDPKINNKKLKAPKKATKKKKLGKK